MLHRRAILPALLGLLCALGVAHATPIPFFLGGSGDASATPGSGAAFANNFTQGTLVSQVGPVLTNTRATASTTVDHESVVRNILAGEARFYGLRRVENPLANSGLLGGATPTSWAYGDDGNGGTSSVIDSSASGHKAIRFADIGVAARHYAVQTIAVVAGHSYRFSVYAEGVAVVPGGNVMSVIPAGATLTGTVSVSGSVITAPGRYSTDLITCTASGNVTVRFGLGTTSATTGDVTLSRPMLEDVTGQADQNPSEYVSTGVLSAPYHGAGVDGVKYFNVENGNTVASNVVTEATGAAIDTSGAVGILPFPAITHYLLQSEDFATTWTTAGAVTTNAAVAPDGLTTADTLTDNSAIATQDFRQSVTVADDSLLRWFRIWIKKTSGTTNHVSLQMSYSGGTAIASGIVIDPDAGTAITRDTAPAFYDVRSWDSNWWLATMAFANNSTGNTTLRHLIQPATNNNGTATQDITAQGSATVWGADGFQLTSTVVAGGVYAPYAKTTTAAVTTNADVISATAPASLQSASEVTLYLEAYPGHYSGGAYALSLDDGSGSERVQILAGVSNTARGFIADGGSTQADINSTASSWPNETIKKVSLRAKANSANLEVAGVDATEDTSVTLPTPTAIRVGCRHANDQQWGDVIKEARIYSSFRPGLTN